MTTQTLLIRHRDIVRELANAIPDTDTERRLRRELTAVSELLRRMRMERS